MDDHEGKVAVVTGAASGSGRALADRWADSGMKVVLADVEEGPLDAARDELDAAGADVLAVRADVSLNFDDSVARTGGRISEIGDLPTAIALDTVDATGRFLHPTPASLTTRGDSHWLRVGAAVQFTLREGADPASRLIRTVP